MSVRDTIEDPSLIFLLALKPPNLFIYALRIKKDKESIVTESIFDTEPIETLELNINQ